MKRIHARLATILACLVAVALALTTTAVPAQAATYWTFKNDARGTCLTGSGSGKAYVTTCSGSSSQDWDWIGGDTYYNQLKNRSTGLCLMTDEKTETNAVWTSTCSTNPGQQWNYEYQRDGYGKLWSFLTGNSITNHHHLRTSPASPAAVYSGSSEDYEHYATWSRLS